MFHAAKHRKRHVNKCGNQKMSDLIARKMLLLTLHGILEEFTKSIIRFLNLTHLIDGDSFIILD